MKHTDPLTGKGGVQSPAVNRAHELGHFLHPKVTDEEVITTTVEVPIAKELRAQGFGEGVRTKHGTVKRAYDDWNGEIQVNYSIDTAKSP